MADFHLLFAVFALVVSLIAGGYAVRVSRTRKKWVAGRSRQRTIGVDAWVSEQVDLWRQGKLRSRIEHDGPNVREIIEPLPGWHISVAVTIDGDRLLCKHRS